MKVSIIIINNIIININIITISIIIIIAVITTIIFMLLAIGKFTYGFRTGLLDQSLTEENKRFYEGIKVVLTNSMLLSRSTWMKYFYWKKYKELKEGMRDWYKIGLKHTKTVMDLVRTAEKLGKDLDERFGIMFLSSFRLSVFGTFNVYNKVQI